MSITKLQFNRAQVLEVEIKKACVALERFEEYTEIVFYNTQSTSPKLTLNIHDPEYKLLRDTMRNYYLAEIKKIRDEFDEIVEPEKQNACKEKSND